MVPHVLRFREGGRRGRSEGAVRVGDVEARGEGGWGDMLRYLQSTFAYSMVLWSPRRISLIFDTGMYTFTFRKGKEGERITFMTVAHLLCCQYNTCARDALPPFPDRRNPALPPSSHCF